MNILLTLAFHGGKYHGFQVQKNALGVCSVIQDSMERIFGLRPDVKGCSRTDAGVHARHYALSFRHETPITDEKLPMALNRHLPPDIRVLCACRVPEDFHARYTATGKEYEYIILNGAVDDPFTPGQYYRMYPTLDVEAMQRAADYLTGKHDFSAFMSAGSGMEDTVRTVTALRVERRGPRVVIAIAADGFLYNMVRIIAGTLLRVGTHKMLPGQMAEILQTKDRASAGETLPAKGLFLNRVFYPPEFHLGDTE